MKKIISRLDKPLLFMTIIYTILGLIMIFSSSNVAAILRYHKSPYYYFFKQTAFYVVSYLFGLFILRFPLRNYKKLISLAVAGIIAALAGLFLYGTIINSAQSWYNLGFVSIQPTEFAKTVIIVYFAFYFSKHQKDGNPYSFLRPLLVSAIIVLLIVFQPDLGGGIIVAGLVFLLFLSIPLPKNNKSKLFKTAGIALIIGVAIFVYIGNGLNDMQISRFTFKNPCSRYTEDTGYQVCNGLIAVSNGGLLGKGLGNSTQKYLYLPEAHTDFIFPIIAEELGSIVASLIIVGYGYILWRILKIAKNSENLRNSIICYGTFIFILLHILINLLGVFALIPLTGVPLPLLSYGGSFNLNVIILLFLVQRVQIENKIIKSQKDITSM